MSTELHHSALRHAQEMLLQATRKNDAIRAEKGLSQFDVSDYSDMCIMVKEALDAVNAVLSHRPPR